jgi:hypothetical protein
MQLRICFENMESVNVNDASMMRHYAESYLDDFRPEWGGFVMLPHDETVRKTMEPVWQMFIRNASEEKESKLLNYLRRNPMAAYHVHVYRNEDGQEVKVMAPSA